MRHFMPRMRSDSMLAKASKSNCINSPAPAAAAAALLDGAIDIDLGRTDAGDESARPGSELHLWSAFARLSRAIRFFWSAERKVREFQLADLPRLKFATVSEVPTPWLCLQHDLRDQGVDPDRIDRVSDRTMASNLEALRSRRTGRGADVRAVCVAWPCERRGRNPLRRERARTNRAIRRFSRPAMVFERNRDAFIAMTRAHPPHAALARRAQRGGIGARVAAHFTRTIARDILASSLAALSRCRTVGANA